MACDFSELSAYLDGELSEADRRRIESHIKECAACTAEFEELKRALQLAPENVLMRSTLGRMYLQDKRYADALDQYQRLANQQPRVADHHFHIGQIHEQLGDNEKAKLAYNNALERTPDHKEAMERLEVLYEGQEVPRPKPLQPEVFESRPEPVAAVTGDDPLGNLESLLGVSSLEDSAPPPPPPGGGPPGLRKANPPHHPRPPVWPRHPPMSPCRSPRQPQPTTAPMICWPR